MFWSSGDFAVLHAEDSPWNCNITQHGQLSHLCVKGRSQLGWNTKWQKKHGTKISLAVLLIPTSLREENVNIF